MSPRQAEPILRSRCCSVYCDWGWEVCSLHGPNYVPSCGLQITRQLSPVSSHSKKASRCGDKSDERVGQEHCTSVLCSLTCNSMSHCFTVRHLGKRHVISTLAYDRETFISAASLHRNLKEEISSCCFSIICIDPEHLRSSPWLQIFDAPTFQENLRYLYCRRGDASGSRISYFSAII